MPIAKPSTRQTLNERLDRLDDAVLLRILSFVESRWPESAAALPPIYWRTPEPKPPVAVPDKAAIKLSLQAGQDVPGARLTQTTKLLIK